MRLYAQRPDLRLRQLAADAGILAWTVAWIVVARAVHRAVLALAGPGEGLADLGRSVASSMSSAADGADRVPVAGDALAKPFAALGTAGRSVSSAGRSAEHAVGRLAALLAVALVVLAVGWLLLRWLPWRWRYAREAGAATRVLSGTPDLELLAVRALATAPLPRLAALPPGIGAGWHAGDPAAVRALAELELGRLGLRLPAADAAGSGGTGSGTTASLMSERDSGSVGVDGAQLG